VENALRTAGIRDAVVLETRPGRIEAVVLVPHPPTAPASSSTPRGDLVGPHAAETRAASRPRFGRRTQGLAVHQRVAAWRPWPESDFPRTHTFKVKRDAVRRWASVDVPTRGARERGSAAATPADPQEFDSGVSAAVVSSTEQEGNGHDQ